MILMQIVREVRVPTEGGTTRCKRYQVRVEDNILFLFAAVHHTIHIFNSILERL